MNSHKLGTRETNVSNNTVYKCKIRCLVIPHLNESQFDFK
jgi:hypothetical protein